MVKIIGLRWGHSVNCRGAHGKIDEVDSCMKLFYIVKALLEAQGYIVVDCNSYANSEAIELSEGTYKANIAKVDIYITLHMNSFNGQARGVECWVYDANSIIAKKIASKICSNISSMGIPNRGVKYSIGYHDLANSNMQAIIVENIFCDNAEDVAIFNANVNKFARAIANAIDSNISLEEDLDMDKIVVYLGDADVFAAIMVSQKFGCPCVKKADFEMSGLKAKEVIQIGGNTGDTNRFDAMKNASNKYL